MATEIERKFHLPRAPARLAAREGKEIEQGYLAVDAGSEVRLRRRGEDRILTVKRGRGESRDELEVSLDAELFERLWAVTAGRRLVKRRTVVGLDGGLEAEVDVYAGRLEGLVVVEVEFGSQQESEAFTPPSWFGEEVTGDERYANQALALATVPPAIGDGQGGNQEAMDDSQGQSRGSAAYRLKASEAPAAGLRRIAAGRLRKATGRLRDAQRGEDVSDSIHGARKDLKKLRAALRLVRDELGEKRYRAENERYRAAGRMLSATRDAQVKGETLAALLDAVELDASTLLIAEAWGRALGEEREAATARAEGDDEATIGPVLELLEGADPPASWSLSERRSWKLVAAGLTRAYKRGRQAMGEAEGGDPDAVHQWRKRAKDLRYQLQILKVIWPDEIEAEAERAHRLTDLLGASHDLTVLSVDLEGRGFPRSEAMALGAALDERRRELLGEAIGLGRRVYVERPKDFRQRIHGYWKLGAPPQG
jgi:CYTH domain-containing protein/CHAD domain-containing protein